MSLPKLSVVVPIFNVEAYLPRCLDSILSQTFQDYELILVNDGSPDGCAKIMAEYAIKDPRIRQIHKENGGLSSARNAGLDIASGTYVSFIDADDYISETMFDEVVTCAQETGTDLVVWNYSKANDKEVFPPYLHIADEVIELSTLGLQDYFYKYWFPYKHGHEVCNKLYRRDIIEQSGLRFQPNNEILAEDLLFNSMYLLHIQKIVSLKKSYYFYYTRSNSIMNSPRPRAAHRLMTLAIRLTEYIHKQGLEHEMRDVLPVLCYMNLITKGIALDPSLDDVYAAMYEYKNHVVMRKILKDLLRLAPLTMYTLKTRHGLFIHVRARFFALQWLNGNVKGAARLVHRIVS